MEEQITGFRLSTQQERVWRFGTEHAAFRAQAVVRLTGALRPQLLKETLERVVARHEILRTSFRAMPGLRTAVQVVAPAGGISWREDALAAAATTTEQDETIERLLGEESRAQTATALRATLLKLAPESHLLLLTLPAMCADAPTLKHLVAETAAGYGGALEGDPAQYVSFAEWQHELLEGEEAAEAAAFWGRQSLAEPPLVAPREKKTTAASEFREFTPRTLALATDAATVEGLEELAARHRSSLSTCLLAAWQALLWRLAEQAEVSIGVALDGRKFEELHGALGAYVKSVPISCEVREAMRFGELTARLDDALAEAGEWQEFFLREPGVAEIGAEAQPDRGFFAYGFEFVEWPAAEESGGVSFSLVSQRAWVEPFKLKLSCTRTGGALALDFQYDADSFERAEIDALAARFGGLLRELAARPESCVGDLEMLGADERRRLLVEWNSTAAAFPSDKCLHELFEAQAARTPAAVAVEFEGRSLSYAELNERANQLARHLRARGVGSDERVGLLAARSTEAVVGIFGVLKAGAAYLPLDPSYPRERLDFMMADAGVRTVLTQQRYTALLAENVDAVCLDSEWERVERESGEPVPNATTPDGLAYVIYTSGSTGQPKGVMVPHRGLVNYLSWGVKEYALAAGDGAPVHSSLGFDLTVTSLLAPLLAGRRVLLLPEGRGVEMLGAALRGAHDFSLVKITPAHLDLLRREMEGREAAGATAKVFVIGGEALSGADLAFWRAYAPEARLINEYGPTETVVGCSIYEAPPGELPSGTLSIGRPVANTRMYVLNSRQRLVPVGVPGEIYIGGAGVARGYVNQPALTAARFIPDPFAAVPGSRLYRTGDLARYLADGRLEFLGRTDEQVKVRGYRIELGEVEAALRAAPGVRDCAVAAREDATGGRTLVAYLVAGESQAVDETMLRAHLSEKLPDYMIPSAFVALGQLPLTTNGKVDRAALPSPAAATAGRADDLSAPATMIEDVLTSIWCEVLGRERVGVGDNFFELGGHSLLATQLMSRVRASFGVELKLNTLFDAPTIAGLARAVESAMKSDATPEMPGIERVERGVPLPLSFAQQRLWFLHQVESESPFYNVPAAVRLRGRLDVDALERTLTEVVRRHEVLRTTFSVEAGRPVQLIHDPYQVQLPLTDLSIFAESEREAEAHRVASTEARLPFDLGRGPLLRARLLRLSAEEHVAVLVMHHIVSDGWSMGVLVREVAALYAAYARGEASPLAELPVQYADFAAWQRGWLTGEALERQLGYWRERLTGAPPVLELPTDRPRPHAPTWGGAAHGFRITGEAAAGLRRLSRSAGATPFMTLLAGFEALLYRYTGQEQMLIGAPIANRTRGETEGLIGFFVNTLVVRGDLSGDPTFRELVGRAREAALGAYAHQDVPFERVVEELQPERDLSRMPLFQILFVLQNAPAEELKLPELELTVMRQSQVTSQFDLSLSLEEQEDGLNASLGYSIDLFDASTIERMAGHFQMLLEAAVSNPELRISELPLYDDAEHESLVRAAQPSPESYPVESCLHEEFAEQARRTPDATALSYGDESLSYAELDARASRLAAQLRRHGVAPESLVGLCVERSLGMVVAILGILKAGGAYLPLDPEYPRERLSFMLADARPAVVLCGEGLAERLGECPALIITLDEGGAAVQVDDDDGAALQADDTDNARTAVPGNLAYVIYTSGSTGRPKGSLITHANVARLFSAARALFTPDERDVWTLFHSYAFDFSVWELWGALLYGGKLVIVPHLTSRAPEQFHQLLRDERVTVLSQTPSAFRQLDAADARASAEQRNALRLRLIIFGGEALDPRWLRGWLARRDGHSEGGGHSNSPRLVNMYGITETTVHVTHRELGAAEVQAATGASPIGAALADLRLYVLDARMRPSPRGVSGELYVGGAGLSRGYLHRAGLTAERFVPDPFGAEAGSRLYRTGDVGRVGATGEVEYVGRADEQVKVRGFRIELGEVEAAVRAHAAVRECVAVVLRRKGAGASTSMGTSESASMSESASEGIGEARLVAYVVLERGAEAGAGELRRAARERLPEYMVPGAVVVVESIPLTAHGKVDRGALPEPGEGDVAGAEEGYVAARSVAEEVMCGVWAEVLGVGRVGVRDNFFELGGHSVLLTQLASRIRETFHVEVPLRALFNAPTVEDMTLVISAKQVEQEDDDEMAALLRELKELSPEEARALLEADESLLM